MSRLLLLGAGASAPSTPSSTLKLWLKADALTGLADEDLVTSWPDSSGVSGPAVQVFAERCPTYLGNALNGLPIVRFHGGQALSVAQLSLGAFTIFSVWRAFDNGLIYEHSPNINAGAQSGCFL